MKYENQMKPPPPGPFYNQPSHEMKRERSFTIEVIKNKIDILFLHFIS